MYNGVKAMIEREKELGGGVQPAAASQPAAAEQPAAVEMEETKVGPHLKKPEDIKGFPVFPPGTKSLLSKCMTKDVWDEL